MLDYISRLPGPDYARKWPRSLVILGSTGSIGQNTLAVAAEQPDYFTILALAGGKNVKLLAEQAERWKPRFLAVQDDTCAAALRPLLSYKPEILIGREGYMALAALPEADMVVSAQVGAAGLAGTAAAARAGKVIALANKESLVMAGDILRGLCAENGASILPVDSEHNAIFQCLMGQQTLSFAPSLTAPAKGQTPPPCVDVRRLVLTASGGPFRRRDKEFLEQARKEDALAHPVWNMGAKISVDSATLMNKGLEIIEACHLYGLPPQNVDVLIHPQSIVHSFVEYTDNSQLAQLGRPDMRIPISHCLGWPWRLNSGAGALDLLESGPLSFEKADEELFPAMRLCRLAVSGGRGLCLALNVANEVAVSLFLQDRISFTGITALVRKMLESWNESRAPANVEEALLYAEKARTLAEEMAKNSSMV